MRKNRSWLRDVGLCGDARPSERGTYHAKVDTLGAYPAGGDDRHRAGSVADFSIPPRANRRRRRARISRRAGTGPRSRRARQRVRRPASRRPARAAGHAGPQPAPPLPPSPATMRERAPPPGRSAGLQPSGARADRIAGRRARSSSRPVPRSIGQWPPACRAGAIPPSEACERETSGFRPVPARGAPAAFGKPIAYGGCPGRARPDLWPSSRPWPAMGAGEGLSGNRRCVLIGPRQPAWSCPPVFPQRPCAPTR